MPAGRGDGDGLVPEEPQPDVAHRIAIMDRTSPTDPPGRVDLERRSRRLSSATSAVGGLQPLVEILNPADRGTERLILEGLEQHDPELADQVRNQMFVFEDLTNLDDRAVQLVLRPVQANELAVALKGVDAKVRSKVPATCPSAPRNLTEEIQLLGPIKLKPVEEAQGPIVRVIRTLEEPGQIDMSRGGDELVV